MTTTLSRPDLETSDRDNALDRWVATTDLPLLVLALVSVPLLVLEAHGNATVASFALFANWLIWALFAIDLLVRVWLVRSDRLRYLARNWFDVAIVILAMLPLLRPLRLLRSARVLRLVRSLRVVGFLGRFWHSAVRMWNGFHGRIIGIAALVILIAGSVGIWTVERNAGGPIDGFSDAMWWSLTTITTVGYGDTYPVTPEGRGIAAFLMMSGIAVFGVVSANLAALFLRSPEDSREDELLRRIEQLTAVVEELKTERSSIHA